MFEPCHASIVRSCVQCTSFLSAGHHAGARSVGRSFSTPRQVYRDGNEEEGGMLCRGRQVSVCSSHKLAVHGRIRRLHRHPFEHNMTNMTSNKITPNNLRAHRIKAGLRQLDVARALGLESTDRISRWENGSAVPHILNLFKLARLYGTQPEKLYVELFSNVGMSIHPEVLCSEQALISEQES